MWGYVPGLLLCFSSCSFGHELGAGMVNKQVLGTEVKGGLGEEPRPGSWRTVQGKGRTEGHCLQGALWSLAAYGNYLHAFATLGPVGDWGCWSHQPSEGDSCPHLGIFANLYSMWASIYRQEAEVASPEPRLEEIRKRRQQPHPVPGAPAQGV